MREKITKATALAVLAGALLIFCGVFCGFAGGYPAGTSVGGVDISGLTYARAEEKVRESLRRELSEKQLKITAGGKKYVFRYPEINVKTNLSSALAAAKKGGARPLERRYRLVCRESVLRGICDDFYRKSENAELIFDASAAEPFTYRTERSGQFLDGTVLAKAVDKALEGGFEEIKLQPERVPARITVEKLKRDTCLLSRFSTKYNASVTGRAKNIAQAANKLNGTVIAAGAEFSFNRTVGDRTRANGFFEAPIIFDGDFVSGVGGGVCQASTTVYNAALLAGMGIKEYHPHSLSVGYVEPSFDAMVSGKNADLRFVNRDGRAVYLVCRAENGKICAEFYGRKSAYSYRRESVVTEVISPPEPEYAENENTKLRAAKDGLKSCGYLLTYKNGVLVGRKRIRSDSYAPVRGVLAKPEDSAPDGFAARFKIA